MAKTTAKKGDLQVMTDEQFIEHLKHFPYPSQWEHPGSYRYAELRLSHLHGDVYLRTGNISAFRTRPLSKDFIPI